MDDIIIFNVRDLEELIAYDFFTGSDIIAFRQQLSDGTGKVEPMIRLAIDVSAKSVIATDRSRLKDSANYINRKYFQDLEAEISDCKGSMVYTGKLQFCRVEKEVIWFQNDQEAIADGTENGGKRLKHMIPEYAFNWQRFPKMGDRRSKVVLLLLEQEKINEPLNA